MGTATFVTNSQAEATQFFLNLPFGETMYEQTDGSYDNPFKFNAKELDDDTGLYYYGARYYNPRLSVWYGVDPLAEDFPGWSPYVYTFNNPINLTDPDGMAPVDPKPGFWKGFFTSVGRGIERGIKHVMNNPNHAGYGYSPNMKTPKVSDFTPYQINWSQQLDPTWQAQNFSSNVVYGTTGFIGGILDVDGARVAQSLPKLASAYATISVLRGFKLSEGSGNSTLNILKGDYSSSEIRAANYMWQEGNNVTLRPPSGSKNAMGTGGTSDMTVNGVNYDVYTPTTSNVNSIISSMAKKNKQTQGIVLDLSKSGANPSQFNNALKRVQGAGAKNIKDIKVIPK